MLAMNASLPWALPGRDALGAISPFFLQFVPICDDVCVLEWLLSQCTISAMEVQDC